MLRRLLLLGALLCSSCAGAKDPPGSTLAFDQPGMQTAGRIAVTSPAFAQGKPIPLRYSSYGEGISPPLKWSGVPKGAASVALLIEDPDASAGPPFVHWVVWNIDPAAGGLPENVKMAGIVQGKNSTGNSGYFGPKPPGTKPHRYFFEVFAFDRKLDLGADAGREGLLAEGAGHLLAKGELMGTFRKP
jgi:Raf kinase inhibitor-like YbhB/YbcL family protein